MSPISKLLTCFIAVSALALYGCGGDSKVKPEASAAAPMPAAPMPAAPMPDGPTEGPACATSATSQACVDEKKAALDAATKAQETLKADDNATQKQLADAQTAVDDAQEAFDDAMAARNTYLAMQPSTYDAKAMATAFDGVPTALGGGLTTANPSTDTVRGGMVTVPDADGDNTYAKATWPVPKITGWAGSVWERSSSPMDSVVVYTNVQDAANAKYNTYYYPSTGSSRDDDAPAADSGWSYKMWAGVTSVAAQQTDDADDPNKPNVITLAVAVGTAHELYSAEMLPTGNGITKTYPDGDEVAALDQVEFCRVVQRRDGHVHVQCGYMLGGDQRRWRTLHANRHLDLHCGFEGRHGGRRFGGRRLSGLRLLGEYGRLRRRHEYMVKAFFRGEVPSGDVATLEGSATYKGAAAGLYTKRALTPGGDGDVTAAGRFTADAELTANFGGDSVAVDDEDSISGMIKNFMDGGMMIDAAWLVELNKIQGATFNAGGREGTFTDGTTTGGGSWNGMFYGTVDATTTPQHTLPSGVAGEFTAGFNNGDLIGSFGATKTKK